MEESRETNNLEFNDTSEATNSLLFHETSFTTSLPVIEIDWYRVMAFSSSTLIVSYTISKYFFK
jgi:hypothetical protein